MTAADLKAARKREQAKLRMRRYRAIRKSGRRLVELPASIADEIDADGDEFTEAVIAILRRALTPIA